LSVKREGEQRQTTREQMMRSSRDARQAYPRSFISRT
jgi:hypothetical protein